MSTEFFPTKLIPWATFGTSVPPEGLRYEVDPERPGGGPIGKPGTCVGIASDKSYLFAWRTRQACGEVDGGTYFELFGSAQFSGNGGAILAALARYLGLRFVSQIGQLVGLDGTIETGVWDDALIVAARATRYPAGVDIPPTSGLRPREPTR
jgi:hypothetical protein